MIGDLKEPLEPSRAAIRVASTSPPSPSAVEATLDDGQIAMIAYDIDSAEIGAAKVALARTMDARVRRLVRQMLVTHTADEERLNAIARADNIMPTDSSTGAKLMRDGRDHEQALMGQFDESFDREYVAGRLQVDQRALELFDNTLLRNVGDRRLRAELESTRIEVVEQIRMTEKLRASLGPL
jgi:predicted outer membrane protein